MAPQQTTHSRGKSRLAILTASLRCRATTGGYRGRLRCQRVVRRNRAPQEPRAIKIIGHAPAMLQLGPARQLREYPVCRRNCRWAVCLQGHGLGEGGAVGRGRAAERERGARGRGVCVCMCVMEREREWHNSGRQTRGARCRRPCSCQRRGPQQTTGAQPCTAHCQWAAIDTSKYNVGCDRCTPTSSTVGVGFASAVMLDVIIRSREEITGDGWAGEPAIWRTVRCASPPPSCDFGCCPSWSPYSALAPLASISTLTQPAAFIIAHAALGR